MIGPASDTFPVSVNVTDPVPAPVLTPLVPTNRLLLPLLKLSEPPLTDALSAPTLLELFRATVAPLAVVTLREATVIGADCVMLPFEPVPDKISKRPPAGDPETVSLIAAPMLMVLPAPSVSA